MKKMVAVGLIGLGLAVGLVIPGVFAQSPQGEVQKWEQFCEVPPARGGYEKATKMMSESVAAHGKSGYQLVGAAPWDGNIWLLCYRRPAR
ncbi:MAG: hypothetical protein OEN21_03600 [Myxococcales bacterium]|nr:hypothetical protein [Myxococcales bacterium]